ncbi:unnamed protein product [Microthlaspi erraticum]|uniref:Uncharacterized protein n=1 Tax=Microthlaspi erraticum TaxID=1685480 RepID=A0A6D2KVD1_9BRAS|nr:unnamed protein product [Microthlaspi erraticum]CAA7056039.1 unnamed protein product [Microthlaspi erraticum]
MRANDVTQWQYMLCGRDETWISQGRILDGWIEKQIHLTVGNNARPYLFKVRVILRKKLIGQKRLLANLVQCHLSLQQHMSITGSPLGKP